MIWAIWDSISHIFKIEKQGYSTYFHTLHVSIQTKEFLLKFFGSKKKIVQPNAQNLTILQGVFSKECQEVTFCLSTPDVIFSMVQSL